GELALPEAMTAIGLLLGTLPLIGPPVPPGDSPRDPGDAGPDGGPGEDTCTGEDPATVTGKFYAVRDVYNSPRPVHGPIPVLVAGGGEKRTLDLAARYGDACNVFAGEPAQVRHKFDVLARHCERVGRNPAEITKTVFAFDTSDLGALAASAQALAAAGADGMIIVGPEDPSKIPAIGRVLADVFP
ncbi:MAG TPA: LLM class flavin-dependent oxidoreductase, partial [Trebonia sp.]|nr:LLM class flavin-dependent oxidoreductase [Trebonia sp.]